jgi:membrane protein YdbS with pleckstrin-like domain
VLAVILVAGGAVYAVYKSIVFDWGQTQAFDANVALVTLTFVTSIAELIIAVALYRYADSREHIDEETRPLLQDGDAKTKPVAVSFLSLFRFAEPIDVVMIILGSIAAAGHGAAQPMFVVFFGTVINNFSSTNIEHLLDDVRDIGGIVLCCERSWIDRLQRSSFCISALAPSSSLTYRFGHASTYFITIMIIILIIIIIIIINIIIIIIIILIRFHVCSHSFQVAFFIISGQRQVRL